MNTVVVVGIIIGIVVLAAAVLFAIWMLGGVAAPTCNNDSDPNTHARCGRAAVNVTQTST